MKNNPIGIFDSGLGGLSVVREIEKILPGENIVYLGDTARVPYGVRSPEIIKKFSQEDVEFLLKHNVKCIVIACNTASSVAAKFIKNKFKDIKIFDVISPTMKQIKNPQNTAVIGTRATIKSGAYKVKYAKECPLFVPVIEEGEIDDEIIFAVTKKYMEYFKDKDIDNLILGCTHYPIIKDTIQNVIGTKVNLINPAEFVVLDLKQFLIKNNMLSTKKNGVHRYYVTDLNERFLNIAEMFLGYNISSSIKKINL